ncbi:MAG: DUF882 domain-containing protein, partial [Alphaproteobacteria bacterium]|nr:DUF882 domain-containing protein [Alphaproteobacteria bacterium]
MKILRRFLSLMLLCALCACGGGYHPETLIGRGMPKTPPDPYAVRRIVLVEPYTHERLNVVYYHNGHYDRRALRKIDYLFRDRHAGVVGRIDPEL